MKIFVIGAYPNSVVGFRGQLIKKLATEGHQVTVLSAPASAAIIDEIESLGAKFISYSVQRNGLNPLKDLKTLWQLYKLFKKHQPDKVLAYTIKPIIWGGIAARVINNIDFYAMVTGLGYAFEKGNLKRQLVNFLVKKLYRMSLTESKGVIFQNEDNRDIFTSLRLVNEQKTHRVFGSGVDTEQYKRCELPSTDSSCFLLIARLLGDKGIREYVAAAKMVKSKHPNVRIQLVGPYDTSPDKITADEVTQWVDEGAIEYLGETNNVIPYINNCHIYVLPSYHEGLPRTVLEAMAIGRPIITTDASGCRDTVIEDRNGRLVPVKDTEQLANTMCWFIENPDNWQQMADASREIVEANFDVHKVNQHILTILEL